MSQKPNKPNKPKYKYNVYFTIEERQNGKTKLLIDNEGYICGIYPTYRHAKAAMPKIRRNLIRHFKKRDRLKKEEQSG
jgi:hypothetical protein